MDNTPGQEPTPDPIAETYGAPAEETRPVAGKLAEGPNSFVPFDFSLLSYDNHDHIEQNDRVQFVRNGAERTGTVGLIHYGRVMSVAQGNFFDAGNDGITFQDDDIVLVLMIENEPDLSQLFVVLFDQRDPLSTVQLLEMSVLQKADDIMRYQQQQQEQQQQQTGAYGETATAGYNVFSPIQEPGLKQLDAVVFPSTERTIYVRHDEKYGGAHRYVVANSLGYDPGRKEAVYAHGSHQVLQFVNGVYGTAEQVPGLQSEQIVLILLDRLKKMNAVYPDPSNAKQQAGLEMFLEGCADRVRAREERGVMGQHKS